MKRVIVLVTAFTIMLAMVAGCSVKSDERHKGQNAGGQKPVAATSVMEVLGSDMRTVYENRGTSLPIAVVYAYQGDGERVESPLIGEAAVNAALDAIAQITVIGETDITVTDNDCSYRFINADGSEAGSVSFNGGNLESGGKKYEVDNDKALAAMDFPAESSRDTLAIDGPDPRLAEFFERCKTEEPLRIKVVRDGSEYEITNADVIRETVDALYAINLETYALHGTEPPSTTLTATFAFTDNTEYSLTLYDGVIYIYEFPEPLGTWSYWTDGAEYFLEALGVTAE